MAASTHATRQPRRYPGRIEPSAPLSAGDLIAEKYRVERVIGEGGMGIVYAARHEVLGQRVALKVLRPDYAGIEEVNVRFLQEARTATRIESEHVARTLDVGKLKSGLPYIVIEHLEGKDLADVLIESGPLSISDAVDHVLQALEAVAEAHAMGLVHRDLKPSNLFLARRKDGSVTVKVLDFGITKTSFDDDAVRLTSTSQILGTPAYMSPEQLRQSREVDARADVWAVGVVLYELLSGKLPFIGAGVGSLFAAILEESPRPLRELRADVPAELDAAIMKCLVRSRASRWQSVAELAQVLGPYGSRSATVSSERILRVLPLDVPVEDDPAPNTSRLPSSDSFLAAPAPQTGPQLAGPAAGAGASRLAGPTVRMQPQPTAAGGAQARSPSDPGAPPASDPLQMAPGSPMISTGASWADASQASSPVKRKIPVAALVAFVTLGSIGLGLGIASVAGGKPKIDGVTPGTQTAPSRDTSAGASALPTAPVPLPNETASAGSAPVDPRATTATTAATTTATTTATATAGTAGTGKGTTATTAGTSTVRRPVVPRLNGSTATPPSAPSGASSARPNAGILDRN